MAKLQVLLILLIIFLSVSAGKFNRKRAKPQKSRQVASLGYKREKSESNRNSRLGMTINADVSPLINLGGNLLINALKPKKSPSTKSPKMNVQLKKLVQMENVPEENAPKQNVQLKKAVPTEKAPNSSHNFKIITSLVFVFTFLLQ